MRIVTLLVSAIVSGCLPRPAPAMPEANATATQQAAPGVASSPTSSASAPGAALPTPQQPPTYDPPLQTSSPVQPYAAPPLYPAPQPYPVPQPYPAPAGAAASLRQRHGGDPEVIVDFTVLGALTAAEVLARKDVTDGGAGTFLLFAGLAGGGAAGWLLTEAYPTDPGAAHATTLGLLVGAANGALLIEPTHWNDADQAFGLLLFGSAVGTAGGFLYGQTADLTSGQSTFVGNLALLGSATAAFTAIAGSRDGRFGDWEDGALALGLDAGVLGGALLAPSIDWSPRRSKAVLAATAVGALVGGLVSSLVTRPTQSDSTNGDLVAGCMTGGMWGGFGVGILMTQGNEPDVRFSRPTPGSTVTVVPFAGDRGQVGMMAAGSW